MGSGGAAGRQARKVNRNAHRGEFGHLRFDRWIARWHQKPDPRPPPHHCMTLPLLKNSLMVFGQDMYTRGIDRFGYSRNSATLGVIPDLPGYRGSTLSH